MSECQPRSEARLPAVCMLKHSDLYYPVHIHTYGIRCLMSKRNSSSLMQTYGIYIVVTVQATCTLNTGTAATTKVVSSQVYPRLGLQTIWAARNELMYTQANTQHSQSPSTSACGQFVRQCTHIHNIGWLTDIFGLSILTSIYLLN